MGASQGANQEHWAFLELRLRAGAASGGMSPWECKLLARLLSDNRKRSQRNRKAARRSVDIAAFVAWLEENDWPPEAATAKAQERYGVGRATVYAAKKRRKEAMELFEPQPEPKASP
jgi:hypothetical protein